MRNDDLISRKALLEKFAHPPELIYTNVVVDEIRSAPTVSGWISVKDELPGTYKRVITYDKYSGVKENWLLKSKPCVSWSTGFHVTHWMLMPEPPKEG